MKRKIAIVAVVVGLLGIGFGMAPDAVAKPTFAIEESETSTALLAKDQTTNGAYYATAGTVTVDGVVNGDVYCAGQDIYINGRVNGDVLCAGQRVVVRGVVIGDVRTAGQIVDISGRINGAVTSFSQQTTVAGDAVIGRDLNGASQLVDVNGLVIRDVAIAAQKLSISGQVKGQVNAEVEGVTLSGERPVSGDLIYRASAESSIDQKQVGGKVLYTKSVVSERGGSEGPKSLFGLFVGFSVLMTIASVATAILLVAIIPRYYEKSLATVNKKIGTTILAGLSVMLGLPIASVLLLISGIFLPLGLMAIFAGLLMHFLAYTFTAYYVGRWLFSKFIRHSILAMLAGAIVLVIVMVIPFINIPAFLAIQVIGVGGIVITVTDGFKKPDYKLSAKATK